jgi:hypothetical protein
MKTRLLHHVTISVFSKPHDDEQRILQGLDLISPVPTGVLLQQDPEYDSQRPQTTHYRTPDIVLTVQKTQTDDGLMKIYTLFFKKMHDVNRFARQLRDAMTADELKEFQEAPEELLDAEMKLSCRLDKELLMQGKWSLTDDGHCYQIKASLAAYPKTEKNILVALKHLLQKPL